MTRLERMKALKTKSNTRHHRAIGHSWHHKVELKTSIIGPLYKCHCCDGKGFDTIYVTKGLTGKTHYCGDCFERLMVLEMIIEHLKSKGVPEEWL